MQEEYLDKLRLRRLQEIERSGPIHLDASRDETKEQALPPYLKIRVGESNYNEQYRMTKVRHLDNLQPIEVLTTEEINRMQKINRLFQEEMEYPAKTINLPLTPKQRPPFEMPNYNSSLWQEMPMYIPLSFMENFGEETKEIWSMSSRIRHLQEIEEKTIFEEQEEVPDLIEMDE